MLYNYLPPLTLLLRILVGNKLDLRGKWSGQLLPFAVPQHIRLEVLADPFYPLSQLVVVIGVNSRSAPCPNGNTVELRSGGNNHTSNQWFWMGLREFRICQVGIKCLSDSGQHCVQP